MIYEVRDILSMMINLKYNTQENPEWTESLMSVTKNYYRTKFK